MQSYEEILDNARLKFHKEHSIYPEYMEGFNSYDGADNPYEFPAEISREQMKIGSLERSLTEGEINRLRELRQMMDDTPWHKWSYGAYHKEFIKH